MTFQIAALSPSSALGDLDKPSIAIAAARRGSIGLLDTELDTGENLSTGLAACYKAVPQGSFGIRCRIGSLSSLATLLAGTDTGAQPLIVVLYPPSSGIDENELRGEIQLAHDSGMEVAVEVVDLDEARAAEQAGSDILVAKGSEAPGRVSDTTSFVLTQRLMRSTDLPVWVRGGIGRFTVAAVRAAGARGVILDSQLYLARDSLVAEEARHVISSLDGTETEIISQHDKHGFRLYLQKHEDRSANLEDLDESEFTSIISEPGRALLLGQDSAFSASLARHGVTVAGIIELLEQAAEAGLDRARGLRILGEDASLACSHGTRYPIVQGAMTRVSDNADFACAVARGGALPFLALALMRKKQIMPLLAETKEKIEGAPWGVGILGFVPAQLRSEQLEAILEHKPTFALIAGGRPDQAKQLEDAGINTYLHVPSPPILESFIEMGSRRFVFEGRECGGHVGPRSSFVLWEQMMEVMLEAPLPAKEVLDLHVLFAGGVHDSVSAAMVAALAAPLAERGARVGVLVGTAYLFTEEAVATGAIVDRFQEAAINCENTVVLETGPGHAIRCIDSPYKKTFHDRRQDLVSRNRKPSEVKEELELMHLGRLRVASKGIARRGSELVPVPEDQQWSDGMYMIGQVSYMRNSRTTVAELHDDISCGGKEYLESKVSPRVETFKREKEPSEPIAIVGMSCFLPGANDLDTFWRNILTRFDAIDEVPSTHWDWRNYYHEDRMAEDKAISKWGGFLKDIVFDPGRYGIPPKSLEFIDPVQVMMLEVVRLALSDSGYDSRPFSRQKTSMVLANAGHGPIAADYLLRTMLGDQLDHLSEPDKQLVRDSMPDWSEDSLPGNLSNVTAGRVANRFDLGGLNFCVDAACASSLAALYVGVKELRARTSDMVLVGAADTHNQPIDFLNFSKTHALSKDGHCKTFDSSADGIVLGEGLAAVVLKRLSDAERDGDKVYAVVRGIGGSSDGRALSMTAPRPEGQMLAVQRAYEDAGISPDSIELVEAHGTGTVAGDKAEVAALTEVYTQAGARLDSCAIGSVKTNIGHTKCTAGLASLIKVAKSLHHRVLPPTIGVVEPNRACNFDTNPFYINSEARPWINYTGSPRRAAISAFGFGGTNFHTVLEEYQPPLHPPTSYGTVVWPAELFVWQADSREKLIESLTGLERKVSKIKQEQASFTESDANSNDGLRLLELSRSLAYSASNQKDRKSHRLAVVAASLPELSARLATAKEMLASDQPSVEHPQGIYFADAAFYEDARIAFLYPGQGSQRVNMQADLSIYFSEVNELYQYGDRISRNYLEYPISKFVFPPPAFTTEAKKTNTTALTDTRIAQPSMGIADLATHQILESFGVRPDMVAGHSYGEYVALHTGGVLTLDDLFKLSFERGRLLGDPARSTGGGMLAVHSSRRIVDSLIEKLDDVVVANINAPEQIILSGSQGQLRRVEQLAAEKGIATRSIAVSHAFHSPHMSEAKEELASLLDGFELNKPDKDVYSNTTAKRYPGSVDQVRSLLADHVVKPVLFTDQLENMYRDGARIFVEVGPGSVLSSLVESTFAKDPARQVMAVPLDRSGRHGLTQLLHALGMLWTTGRADVRISRLFEGRGENAIEQFATSPTLFRVNSTTMTRISTNQGDSDKTGLSNPTSAARQVRAHKSAPAAAPSSTTQETAMSRNSATGTGNGKISLNQSLRQAVNKTPAVQSNGALSGPEDHAVRLIEEFQEKTLEMTRHIVDAQKEVLIAYLAGNSDRPVSPDALDQKRLEPFTNELQSESRNGDHEAARSNSNISTILPQSGENGKIDSEALIESLMEIVSDRTGYPPEMLDSSLDLEADLGIDSIKRIEIFNSFRKLLPVAVQKQLEGNLEELAGLKTLDAIADWIRKLEMGSVEGSPDLIEASVATATEAQTSGPPVSSLETSIPDAVLHEIHSRFSSRSEDLARINDSISRGVVNVVSDRDELREPANGNHQWPKRVLLTRDDNNLATELAECARARGIEVIEVWHDTTGSESLERLDLLSEESLSQLFSELERTNRLPNWIIHMAGLSADTHLDCQGRRNETERLAQPEGLFHLARQLERTVDRLDTYRPSLIVVTGMGGDFGTSRSDADIHYVSAQAAAAGLIKTIAKEMPQIRSICVDVDSQRSAPGIADGILESALQDQSGSEVGIRSGERNTIEVSRSGYSDANKVETELDSSSVVLVTGGARGITAEVARALAERYHCQFVVVGSSSRPPAQEPSSTATLVSAGDIKAAIMSELRAESTEVSIKEVERRFTRLMKEREIRSSLADLEKHASSVVYYSIDVRDSKAFGEFIDSLYEYYETIDGVIHGAGVIEDNLLKNKSLQSFRRVFDTKVASALTLSEKLQLPSLKFLFFFSSVVGRTGNSGQSDYVAANEALNKLASTLSKRTTARVASILWGPWQGGMARAELEQLFNAFGWGMISPDAGRAIFMEELDRGGKDEVEVVLVGNLDKRSDSFVTPDFSQAGPLVRPARLKSARPPALQVPFDLDQHRYLDDHKLDGMPVLPMAVALELILESARLLYPTRKVAGLADFDIPSGVIFDSEQRQFVVTIEPHDEESAMATVETAGSVRKLHHKARVLFESSLAIQETDKIATANGAIVPVRYSPDMITNPERDVPDVREVYKKWMFHGPIFQGMQKIESLGINGIAGEVIGHTPDVCLKDPGDHGWTIDPTLFDCSMQLGAVWARYYSDITCLPTGFKRLHILNEQTLEHVKVHVFLPEKAYDGEIVCDLAIYDIQGELSVLVESLTGVGSKSFNRFASKPVGAQVD